MAGEPIRIQRRRTKGWRMPPNTVSVTRPGKYGNPYTAKDARECGYAGTDRQIADMCVDFFRKAVLGRLIFCRENVPSLAQISELRGKNLACFCPLDQPCHADVLLELANPPQRSEDAGK